MSDITLNNSNKFVIFSSYYTTTEAYLVKDTLLAAGIVAVIENADVVRVVPWLANGGRGIVIRVLAEQLSEAQKLVASFAAGDLQLEPDNPAYQDDSAETVAATKDRFKTFEIFQHEQGKPTIIAVKHGFCWISLWLGPLWFIANAMWLPCFLSIGLLWTTPRIVLAIGSAANWDITTAKLIALATNLLVWLLIGKTANFLLREELKRRGYKAKTMIQAKTSGDAVFDFQSAKSDS